MFVRGAVVCLVLGGCLPSVLLTTSHEVQSRVQIDTRVGTHHADLRGESCYVETKYRTVSTVHVMDGHWRQLRLFEPLIEAVVVGSIAGAERFNGDEQYFATGVGIDFLLGFSYFLIRDGAVTHSDDWEETRDTAPCPR